MTVRLIERVGCEVIKAYHSNEKIMGHNGVMGPGHCSYITGNVQSTVLEVRPLNPEHSILKEITYNGQTTIDGGDIIVASINLMEETNRIPNGIMDGGREGYDCDYEERRLEEHEVASQLEKLSKDRTRAISQFGNAYK